jgi:hypothetical protein
MGADYYIIFTKAFRMAGDDTSLYLNETHLFIQGKNRVYLKNRFLAKLVYFLAKRLKIEEGYLKGNPTRYESVAAKNKRL